MGQVEADSAVAEPDSAVTAPDSLNQARFHPKLRIYLAIQGVLACIATIVGIVVLPIAIFGIIWWARRYYEALACTVGERALIVQKGIQFRTEKTIPLDKIQDMSVRHGPILNWLGLSKLVVETAGRSSNQGAAASLTGVVDPLKFRDRVLARRDQLVNARGIPAAAAASNATAADDLKLLTEIRDSLRRIESSLRPQADTSE